MISPNRTETVSPTKLLTSLPKNNGWKTDVRPFTAMLFDDYSPSSNSHRWRYETEPRERNIYVHYSK